MDILAIFIAGLLVGTVGAFLGIGGGVIIVPLLTVVFKFPIHDAVATSLAIVVANSVITSRKYLFNEFANLRMGLLIALFSICGSLLGGIVGISVTGKVIYLVLGFSQILTLTFMWLKSTLKKEIVAGDKSGVFHANYYDPAIKTTVSYSLYNIPIVSIIAAASGILSGLVGVGGGVIIVPAMNILSSMPMKAATSTSALTMGFTAAGGGIIYFLSGYVHPEVVATMVPAIVIGSLVATNIAGKTKGEYIYKAFMVFLFLVACQMLYKGFTF